ncbi:unknown [Brachyspira sp. CAG:700]|nr:unknown [Brachyspira sp. CAG:700]
MVVETGYNFTDISIVYYYDSSTLEITFKSKTKSGVDDCLFKGKKYPNNIYFSLKLPLII